MNDQNEVHTQFEPGTERPVAKYRHTIVLEFDTPESDRLYTASMKAMGGRLVAVSFNDALKELETATIDLQSAREDAADAQRALAAAQAQLAQLRAILGEIQDAAGRAGL